MKTGSSGRMTGRKWRSIGALVAAALTIALTISPVTRILTSAWDSGGVSHELIWVLVIVADRHIDEAVVFPAGFVAGVLFLFLLDRYKRIQALLIVLVGVTGFLTTLDRFDRWFETVAWTTNIDVFVIGIVLGILAGIKGGSRRNGHLYFPMSSRLLYGIISWVVVFSFFELHVDYQGPLHVTDGTIEIVGLSYGGLVLDGITTNAIISFLFLFTLGFFVRYTNTKNVVVIAPSTVAKADTLGAIYSHVRDRYEGRALAGGRELNLAANAKNKRELSGIRLRNENAFEYTVMDPLPCRTVIQAYGFEDRKGATIRERDISVLREKAEREKKINYRFITWFWKQTVRLLPRRIRSIISPHSNRLVNIIDDADTLLLVAPVSSVVNTDHLPPNKTDKVEEFIDFHPRYLEKYRRLGEIYDMTSSKKVFIVATEANLAERLYMVRHNRAARIESTKFGAFIGQTLFGGVNSVVVPIARSRGDTGSVEHKGIEELIYQL